MSPDAALVAIVLFVPAMILSISFLWLSLSP